MKPSLYCDTNSISMQFYRGGDPVVLAYRNATVNWWRNEAKYFNIYASKATEYELQRGSYVGQERAASFVKRLSFLQRNRDSYRLASVYLAERLIPQNKQADALHLAIATAHTMDYLMTWNYAHLANVDMQRKLHTINAAEGWRTPLIVSPETIPKVMFGQDIGRKD